MRKWNNLQTSLPVYDAVKQYMIQHSYGPTMDELSEITGLGKSSIHYHLNKLKEVGYLDYQPGKARTIVILRDDIAQEW